MSNKSPGIFHPDPWEQLKNFTDARIGLGRAGTSLPTHELLKFQLSHAQAIDAVHAELDIEALKQQVCELTYCDAELSTLSVTSQAEDRHTYLQRPDLGRRLSEADAYQLQQHNTDEPADLALVIADGLSATAIEQQAIPFLRGLLAELESDPAEWSLAPVVIVRQGRVAIGDDIAGKLGAKMVAVLIGERPGLSSPDSMGIYLTWQPRLGCDDAKRNCISNIRAAGLTPSNAARKCAYLLGDARTKQLSGVGLKDRSEDAVISSQSGEEVFFLASKNT